MSSFGKNKISIEDQLLKLKECGIYMSSDATVDDFFTWKDHDGLKSTPYNPIIETLAGEIEREPYGRPLSNNL